MSMFVSLKISTGIFAFVLWLSLRIFGPHNSGNSIGTAALIGFIFSLVGGYAGAMFLFLPALALFYILIQFYELSITRSFLVVILMGVLGLGMHVILDGIARVLQVA